jgi:hypothetical protein
MADTGHETNETLVLGGTGKDRPPGHEQADRALPSARVGSRSGQPPFDWNFLLDAVLSGVLALPVADD